MQLVHQHQIHRGKVCEGCVDVCVSVLVFVFVFVFERDQSTFGVMYGDCLLLYLEF